MAFVRKRINDAFRVQGVFRTVGTSEFPFVFSIRSHQCQQTCPCREPVSRLARRALGPGAPPADAQALAGEEYGTGGCAWTSTLGLCTAGVFSKAPTPAFVSRVTFTHAVSLCSVLPPARPRLCQQRCEIGVLESRNVSLPEGRRVLRNPAPRTPARKAASSRTCSRRAGVQPRPLLF